jgi:TetR/AcrR family transcriptional repressor of nem operon
MSNIDEDFDRTLKVIYAQFRKVLKSIYDAAVVAGEMKVCDTRKLALFSVALLEGAILSAKASGNSQDYFDSVEMLISYIESYKHG